LPGKLGFGDWLGDPRLHCVAARYVIAALLQLWNGLRIPPDATVSIRVVLYEQGSSYCRL
jgi:hypothetical protein